MALGAEPETFAVIGSDGTIGGALKRALEQRRKHVWGTSRRAEAAERNVFSLDLGDERTWHGLAPADVVFFCAAVTSFAECRADPRRARLINVEGPAKLAELLFSRGSRVVLLSTSAVFDWSRPLVPEDCPPCPTSLYGVLKAEAEERFGQFGPGASIVRLGKILHAELRLLQNWREALGAGREIAAFSDLCMAPVSLDQAVLALIAVGEAGTGIYQLSATHDISYFEAARHLALRMERDPGLVKEASAATAGIPVGEITRFSSLRSSRIQQLTGQAAPDPFSAIDDTFFPHRKKRASDRIQAEER